MEYIPVLTIAGSDSSGGAGIQADIKTISALGCYAYSAVTAVTVQDTQGVSEVHAIPPHIVEGQIRAVMDDIPPKAVKIGMVNDVATIRAISKVMRKYSPKYVVVDPVMVSTSGSPLMQPEAVDTFTKELMPIATLLTPNLPEAEVLKNVKPSSYVLVKGGHCDEGPEKVDRLYDAKGTLVRTYRGESVYTKNTHGTGCSLSSAITALLARGCGLEEAIERAKQWLTEAIKAGTGVEIGRGHGPINHFFSPEPLITICHRGGPKIEKHKFALQFITHQNERFGYLQGAVKALEGGCRWIQLRMKKASDEEVRNVTNQLKPICMEYGAVLLLDDRVELAKELHVDGVHLGKGDMAIDKAREIIGKGKIIGGTANTLDDILRLSEAGVDYIGCGPFRFTTTKERLSPILGTDGYRNIMRDVRRQCKPPIPIVAIGGITANDIPEILGTGVDGIAMSGAILNSNDPTGETRKIVSTIEQTMHASI